MAPLLGESGRRFAHTYMAVPLDDADSIDDIRLGHVRPPGWTNPTPAPTYDLVVLGGGTAGLVCAMGAAGLGARVALVERHLLGGDCLNTGCVPSKALIGAARAMGANRRPDVGAVMPRVRARRATVAAHDSAARLTAAGVDVFFGEGRFADTRSVVVGGHRLRFRKAVVATGGRPAIPSVPGLSSASYFTSETFFELTTLPSRLVILGAGPIGCELAQALARLGTDVTVVDRESRILRREDSDAAALVRRRMEQDGVRFELGSDVTRVRSHAPGGGPVTTGGAEVSLLIADTAGARGSRVLICDALLVATGRVPNVENLGLDAAGIRLGPYGVRVNDRLRTTNPRVFASGDVCSAHALTHAADAASRIVIQNALFFGRKKASALVMPWVTFTDPEVAHVGVTAADVAASGGRLGTVTVDLADVDRAIVDDEAEGFVRVHHERGRLRGCTIVASHAGEMIAEAAYAVTHGGTLADLSATIHPYPTQAEALRKAGDAYRRQALTPGVRRWLARYFAWTR